MDRLVIASGIVSMGLGVGFIVVKQLFPFLSQAYISGGIGAVILGVGMIIWGRRLGTQKQTKSLQ